MGTKEARILDTAFELFLRHGYRKVGMSDIAEASRMSRPTLYASFANKEAILAGLILRQRERNEAATAQRLPAADGLAAQLACLLDIWVLEPAVAAIASPHGADLLANCGNYAPQALADLHAGLEAHLEAVLAPATRDASPMSAAEIAHVLRVAATAIEASAERLPALRRLVAGMITMAIATARAGA